ncbi:MAG: hypothetical protein HS116_07590 [Planctomycetes bacterium]|nr:hypothetical protein [Planctomycetota bacterium]
MPTRTDLNRRAWCAALALSLLAPGWALAEEEVLPMEELQAASRRYLDAFATRPEEAKMQKKLDRRVKTKMSDNASMTEDRAMREILFDWAFDNEGPVRRKEPAAILQACFYFQIFRQRRFELPNQIRSRLTRRDCDEMVKFLDEEIAKKNGAAKP